MSATKDPNRPLYRVFVNNGHGGSEDLCDLDELGALAYFHLIKREESAVTLRVLTLKDDGKRLDGIGEGQESTQ